MTRRQLTTMKKQVAGARGGTGGKASYSGRGKKRQKAAENLMRREDEVSSGNEE